MEVSAQQAATAILGNRSYTSSRDFTYCFVRSAADDVYKRWFASVSDERFPNSAPESADQYDSSDDDLLPIEDDDADLECVVPNEHHQRQGQEVEGASVYSSVGNKLAVPQHCHYQYRGIGLRSMNLYEYSALINVTRKSRENSDTTTRRGAGRRANATFEFHSSHPLAATHHQQLRSKVLVPILAGRSPPRDVGSKQDSDKWRNRAEEYGKYYVTLLVPWSVESPFLPSYTPIFKGLCEWARMASSSSPVGMTWMGRCRYDVLAHLATWITVNKTDKELGMIYRSRNADRWSRAKDTYDHVEG
eukprot:scpid84999/ scgid17911/ 